MASDSAQTEVVLHVQDTGSDDSPPVVYIQNSCGEVYSVRSNISLRSGGVDTDQNILKQIHKLTEPALIADKNDENDEHKKDAIENSKNLIESDILGKENQVKKQANETEENSSNSKNLIESEILGKENKVKQDHESEQSSSKETNKSDVLKEHQEKSTVDPSDIEVKLEPESDGDNSNNKTNKKPVLRVSGKNLKSVLQEIKLKKQLKKKEKKKSKSSNEKKNEPEIKSEPQKVDEGSETTEIELLQNAAIHAEKNYDSNSKPLAIKQLRKRIFSATLGPLSSVESSSEGVRVDLDSNLVNQTIETTVTVKSEKEKGKKYVREICMCHLCGVTLGSKDSLRQHNRRFHRKRSPNPCEKCGKVFYLPEDLRKHMNGVHPVSNRYICDECGATFPRLTQLKIHRLKQHNLGKHHRCSYCNKEFTTANSLKRHFYVHSEMAGFQANLDFKCQMCPRYFNNLSSLKRHIRVRHLIIKSFPCEICGKAFTDSTTLKRHSNTHTRIQACQCYLCSKIFAMPSSLKRHMMTVHALSHESEQYRCIVCRRVFTYQSSLKRHMRIHNDEKPYECEYCGMTFRHSTGRTRHIKTHSDCPIVQKLYTDTGDNQFRIPEYNEEGEGETIEVETVMIDGSTVTVDGNTVT